jgi:hypothetical protein
MSNSAHKRQFSGGLIQPLASIWLALHSGQAGDPFDCAQAGSSLRLKNGCSQDDAVAGTQHIGYYVRLQSTGNRTHSKDNLDHAAKKWEAQRQPPRIS